jgi:uncharacterized protein YggT (Ycf19 family)
MNIRRFVNGLLYFFLGLVEVFLGLRFILKIFGASTANGFVSWVYEMSDVLLEPFRDIFPIRVFENNNILEFSTIFAMLMYAVGAMLLIALVNVITAPIVQSETHDHNYKR